MHISPLPLPRRSPLDFFARLAPRCSVLVMLCSIALAVPVASAGNVLRGAAVADSCIACPADKFGPPNSVTDGDRATMRNLGGGAPGTFTITTAKPVRFDKLVVLPGMTPAGNVSFEIQTNSDPMSAAGSWVSHGGILTRPWADKVPVEVVMNAGTRDIRAVKVIIHQSPSWVAVYEIEGDLGISIWIYAGVIAIVALLLAGLVFRRRQRVVAR